MRAADPSVTKKCLQGIAYAEHMSINDRTLTSIIESSQGDIRKCFTMLSTWALNHKATEAGDAGYSTELVTACGKPEISTAVDCHHEHNS